MGISVRVRFDVLKRDSFTCRYCGRASPDVVLEVDHVVPVCEGGSDDPINLAASCWECNRGKSGAPLAEVLTGEDPHDRAVMLLERERQLREYNAVLAEVNARIEEDRDFLCGYWKDLTGRSVYGSELTWLENALAKYPSETIVKAMNHAGRARKITGFAYVQACLKNWATTGALSTCEVRRP